MLGAVAALPKGTDVSGFQIMDVLGFGGFGVTYKAQHGATRKVVAIKEYFPQGAAVRDGTYVNIRDDQSETIFRWGLDRFVEEAETVLRFDHPNIVRVEQIFGLNGTAYAVLEFIDGINLQTWILDGGGAPDQASIDVFAAAMLDALDQVHRNNILHRDIAPKNILLRGDGAPVLIDFGSARQVVCSKTMAMTALITPHYAPHEQYLSSGRGQGPWTDIYAMAATLYQLISGSHPPEAPSRILGSDEYIPAHAAARGDYRPQFLDAVDWGLKSRCEHRPQSTGEWWGPLLG